MVLVTDVCLWRLWVHGSPVILFITYRNRHLIYLVDMYTCSSFVWNLVCLFLMPFAPQFRYLALTSSNPNGESIHSVKLILLCSSENRIGAPLYRKYMLSSHSGWAWFKRIFVIKKMFYSKDSLAPWFSHFSTHCSYIWWVILSQKFSVHYSFRDPDSRHANLHGVAKFKLF